MKLKKILSAFMACAVMGVCLPAAAYNAQEMFTASASEEYTEGTYGAMTYRNYGDHIEISDCDQSAAEVEIPAEIDGVPVTVIGNNAFYKCSSLSKVTLPDGITSLGFSSFRNCTSLKSITIPDGVVSIGDSAFELCTSLASIDIPDTVTTIGIVAFKCCESLISIELPDNITRIESGIFLGCESLESVTIPDSAELIDIFAFKNCTSLKSITIPESVTEIRESSFYGCTNLSRITILNPDCFIDYAAYTTYNTSDGFTNTIYGYTDSTAQEYAEEHGYAFKAIDFLGDIDADGAINALDASLVLTEYSAIATGQNSTLDDAEKSNADVNSDGAVDALDASYVLSFYAYTAIGGTDTFAEYMN